MAVFKYVTKGVQSLQGKQKIYFCAHPRDYDIYFERIKNEILNTLENSGNTNCALIYLEDPNAERDEEFFFDLKDMDMIVMPVTSRLLNTSNPALDSDFHFAANNSIVILPIMMESELSDTFNEKCGSLQHLDIKPKDITAIPYEEKLALFLTSHLIENEMYEKIRKAFDAYIFLSYRKKDRIYAQELMRLIHKNDFCRDIAIWYDEFLTPGDDFNDSIKAALEKSELFALAVTPNLVNEKNYIMSVEYPMAKSAKKSIIPAELVETDKSELSDKYPDIPDCIDAHNENQLSSSLTNALANIAVRGNDKDPEHNFFIGLAYLAGIDVEKDFERALFLIKSAAEAGLPEAMKKLVSIYNGMPGEHKNTLLWQKRLVEYLKNEYLKKRDETSARQYLKESYNHGEIYDFLYHHNFTWEEMQEEDSDILKNTYRDILTTSQEIYSVFKKPWALLYLSMSYMNYANKISFFEEDENEHNEIKKSYSQAIALAEELLEITNNKTAKRNLGIIYKSYAEKLATETFYDDDIINQINKYYQNALKIFEELSVEYAIIETKYDLANIYYLVGSWMGDSGDIYFSKHLAIMNDIVKESATADAKKNLSFAYRSVSNFKKDAGDFDSAVYYCDEHLRIYEMLAQEVDEAEEYSNLAMHYMMAYYAFKKEKYAQRTLEVYDMLISTHPGNDNYIRDREWAEHQIEVSKIKNPFRRLIESW